MNALSVISLSLSLSLSLTCHQDPLPPGRCPLHWPAPSAADSDQQQQHSGQHSCCCCLTGWPVWAPYSIAVEDDNIQHFLSVQTSKFHVIKNNITLYSLEEVIIWVNLK